MSNTAPSRADPVVDLLLGRWCPPQETSQPHPPQALVKDRDIIIRMKNKHAKVFRKIPGKLNTKQHKLYIDDNVPGVIQKWHRILFNRQEKVKQKLDELLAWDLLKKVNSPSKWVSPIIVEKQNGDIRLCVDMRKANVAVKRVRYPIPTVEETLQDLNGNTVLRKIDLKMGYHQVELTPESREFNVHGSSTAEGRIAN